MILKLKHHILFIFLLLISGILLSYFSYYNEFSEGGSDNIWHYYFSKYAITQPDFFIHHWGKPLFILLSTGFAQFGFFGIKIFNVICGLLTTVMSYKILCHFKISFKWIIVPLLLFSPLYFIVLQSALTEPLFSLLLITSIYLYLKNKYVFATILISFIIFSRSEGSFIIVCFAIYLIVAKQWKYLPLFLVGFITYAIIGALAGHSFFWFFTENPYNYNSPYGHGSYMDILKRYDSIWGLPFLILLCISCLILFYLFIKQKQFMFWKPINETSQVFYLLFVPSFVFLAFHLYAWHFGLYGSAGLERVLACVMPCYAVLTLWAFDKIILSKIPKALNVILISSFLFFHLQTPFTPLGFPLLAYGDVKVELDAAVWFKTIKPKNCIIYYAHPNIIFNLDRNPFDKYLNREQHTFKNDCSVAEQLPIFFFWDSSFSQSSFGVALEDVEKCNYKKIKEFTDGGDFKLVVFEKLH